MFFHCECYWLSEGMSHNSADFFMGLSDCVDPTKDLPPVDGSNRVVAEEEKGPPLHLASGDKGKNVVDGVPLIETAVVVPVGQSPEVVGVIDNRDVVGESKRSQVRRQHQLIHSSSSGDEYEGDPDRRRRVGFLFRTTPRPLLPDFLTEDDRWKLEGCSTRKRIKRAERAAGLVRDF